MYKHGNILFNISGIPLVKFQSAERIESFQNGYMYAKSLEYYRNLEELTGNDEIGDKYEGMIYTDNELFIIDKTGEVGYLNDQLIKTEYSDSYVFCMFGINPLLQSFSFTDKQKDKMLSFGDTALVVLDSDEFVKRVKIAAEREGYEAYFNAIRYGNPGIRNINKTKSLSKGMQNSIFWKREKYSYQQEYRFGFFSKKNKEHIVLYIGDINDITTVLPSKKVLSAMIREH